jgi:hypothetical protein
LLTHGRTIFWHLKLLSVELNFTGFEKLGSSLSNIRAAPNTATGVKAITTALTPQSGTKKAVVLGAARRPFYFDMYLFVQ